MIKIKFNREIIFREPEREEDSYNEINALINICEVCRENFDRYFHHGYSDDMKKIIMKVINSVLSIKN